MDEDVIKSDESPLYSEAYPTWRNWSRGLKPGGSKRASPLSSFVYGHYVDYNTREGKTPPFSPELWGKLMNQFGWPAIEVKGARRRRVTLPENAS